MPTKKLSNDAIIKVKVVISRKKRFFSFVAKFFLTAFRVRGSVFKMKFRVLFREFKSIETSPGFAQLLGVKS